MTDFIAMLNDEDHAAIRTLAPQVNKVLNRQNAVVVSAVFGIILGNILQGIEELNTATEIVHSTALETMNTPKTEENKIS